MMWLWNASWALRPEALHHHGSACWAERPLGWRSGLSFGAQVSSSPGGVAELVPGTVYSPGAWISALLIFRLLKRFGLWLVWSLKCTPPHPLAVSHWECFNGPQLYSLLLGPFSYPWINRVQVAQSICFRETQRKGHLWKQATVPTHIHTRIKAEHVSESLQLLPTSWRLEVTEKTVMCLLEVSG